MMIHRQRRRFGSRRRGTLYMSVMGTAFIVSTVALIAAHQVRVNLKAAQSANDRYQAHMLARSAVEQAVTEIHTNPNWQTAYAYNVEYPSPAVPVNGGTFSWKLIDVGNGSRRLDGIGRVRQAMTIFSVDLAGRDYLACGLSAGGNITLGGNEAVQITGASLATQKTLTNSGLITANVEAQTITNSGTITGTQTSSAPLRPIPTSNNVFEYYVGHGSTLAQTSLDKDLISPNTVPGGATNSLGIYVINANGGSVTIRRSRIVGTLVILNTTGVTIRDQVNWEPALPNYPALLVQGPLNFEFNGIKLSESVAGANFNPQFTPWQNQTDLAQDDEYPSAMAGIIYCSGNITFDGNNDSGALQSFEGMILCGGSCSITRKVSVSILYDAKFHDDPPPGFIPGDPRNIVPGSWRQTKSN